MRINTSQDNLHALDDDEPPQILCVATDKGYHQAELIRSLNQDQGITTYIPERDSSPSRFDTSAFC